MTIEGHKMGQKVSFPIAEEWVQEQLGDTSGQRSMFQIATDVYAEMQLAMEADGIRGILSATAAGTFGGLIKTWKAGLIAAITKDIIKKLEIDVSRERIRSLQLDIFGRSNASKDLKSYAVKIRNGGGRAAPMPVVPDALKEASYNFFLAHEADLKIAVQGKAPVTAD